MSIDYARLRGDAANGASAPTPTPPLSGAGTEADALTFLTALYGEQPSGRILISTPDGKGWPTHACVNPKSALPYVLGGVDVFNRVTLVEGKPKNGRGTAEDTSALTALWIDVDVNGSPDGKGGVVANAALDQKTAIDFLSSVLLPTLLVSSGYGVHAYWLLDEPYLLNDAERPRAKRLVQGWHARFKQEAKDFGMPKFDSVFDLARVLRPVGSFNNKGSVPKLVTLLDDGGPRYSFDELAATALEVTDATPPADAGASNGEARRSVEELLTAYPRLQKMTTRQAKPPGKGSDSEWDFALACEAMRAPKVCSDAEVRALLAYNRSVNPDAKGKGTRFDYIDRTIGAARAETGSIGGSGKQRKAENPGEVISRSWNLADDPVITGQLIGTGPGAVVRLKRATGRLIRIEHLRYLFDRAAHNREVSISAETRFKALTGAQAHDVAQAVISLCERSAPDPTENTEELLGTFVSDSPSVDGVMWESTITRWRAFQSRLEAEQKLPNHQDIHRRTVLIRDEFGRFWIPANAVRAADRYPTWGDLHSLVDECGWSRRQVDMREPGSQKREGGREKRVFYIEPARSESDTEVNS